MDVGKGRTVDEHAGCGSISGKPMHVRPKNPRRTQRCASPGEKAHEVHDQMGGALGRELSRGCKGFHQHQPWADGRAAEAARHPEELCRAICRGIIQEMSERQSCIRAVADIPSQYRPNRLDLEEFHERSEACIPITAFGSLTVSRESSGQANRLTVIRNEKAQVSQGLGRDALIGMRLDGNKVIEARQKGG